MCKARHLFTPIDCFLRHHSNWKFVVQFIIASGLSVATTILSAHIVRFVNDYATNPKYDGFTWETFAIYWEASMWGIAVVIGGFVFCLLMVLLIYSREKDIDRKEIPTAIAEAIKTGQIEASEATANAIVGALIKSGVIISSNVDTEKQNDKEAETSECKKGE